MKHSRSELEKLSKEELIELVIALEDRLSALEKRVEEIESVHCVRRRRFQKTSGK